MLETIIQETSQRLHSTDTELNILDLLQAYDQYISKQGFLWVHRGMGKCLFVGFRETQIIDRSED